MAAAGIYALDHHVRRLNEDHENARLLAVRLSRAPGLTVEAEKPQTNMVYFRTAENAAAIIERLKNGHAVLVSSMGSHLLRAVTHLDVSAVDVERAAKSIRDVCAEHV